ncbi:unnamed protein product [Protopolystoma xenopodis]|uniref:Uncharacterized protein n=1 Tax=Protopolystoma xenopodis TaxID=117903 RepID=A0A3S5A5W5_9PLAT|nr:unnamed protein product [Protopolystoma xenopodis]
MFVLFNTICSSEIAPLQGYAEAQQMHQDAYKAGQKPGLEGLGYSGVEPVPQPGFEEARQNLAGTEINMEDNEEWRNPNQPSSNIGEGSALMLSPPPDINQNIYGTFY